MADKRLGTLFANLMRGFSLNYPIQDKLNFIEQQMLNKLNEKVKLLGKVRLPKRNLTCPIWLRAFSPIWHFWLIIRNIFCRN